MSWESKTINFADLSPNEKPVAVGEYDFLLAGAKVLEGGKLLVKTRVAEDGEFTGRSVSFSLPDAEEYEWSGRVFARLRDSIGVDMEEDEGPVNYLNRAAALGAKFRSSVDANEYIDKETGKKVNATRINMFRIKPSLS